MPPKGSKIARFERESSVEHTPEYDDFIKGLRDYHEKRGTELDAEPKVGARHLNLQKLYERIIGEGGYDSVSDTKARPLMWRKFAEEFIGKGPYIAAQAFQVKSAYYKNLAAYEISNFWKEDPPPKEILEDLTAKGGGIRGRTLENFAPRGTRESDRAGDDSGSDNDSPKIDGDDAATTGRSTRGLRQAPPQRVLFQPDVNPSRQSRTASAAHNASPSPGLQAMNGLTQHTITPLNTTLASYEPRQQPPMLLKPVTTPANNPDYYRLKRKQLEDAVAPAFNKKFKGIMLPGTGFVGPNIYVRAQLALQSGLAQEERFALHHLVKISHERGDKYRFDQFPGLAEALVDKALQVSGLFYAVDWTVLYDNSPDDGSNDVLDGIRGTSDVLEKLKSNIPLDSVAAVESQDFHDELNRITEAALIIRNMVMLDENAQYVARLPLFRDYATIVLNIDHPTMSELQHYTLETIEQICLYYHLSSKHPLYQTLLRQIDGNDRGRIVSALRACARLGMRFRENKRLENVPAQTLRNISSWLALNDEDLRSACLDFLFQFSSVGTNVDFLLRNVDLPKLISQLSSLLLYEAEKRPYVSRRQPEREEEDEEENAPSKVPRLAKGLIEHLLDYAEPERSSHWLRMCFEDDPVAEMTQIDLWRSYQGTFLPYAASHPHLIAGDFIKNVSNTFDGASAQVAGQNKYVIRGIKPRATPVDYKGRELLRCQWHVDRSQEEGQVPSIFAFSGGSQCGEFFPNSGGLLEHILVHHIQVPRKRLTPAGGGAATTPPPSKTGLGSFDFSSVAQGKPATCQWSTCRHSIPSDVSHAPLRWLLLARHIATHLPDGELVAAGESSGKKSAADTQESEQYWLTTATDESLKDPTGLPLGAVLCLRNIARGLSRMPDEGEVIEQLLAIVGVSADERSEILEEAKEQTTEVDPEIQEDEGKSDLPRVPPTKITSKSVLARRLFAAAKGRLFFVMGHNRVLREHVGEVLRLLARLG